MAWTARLPRCDFGKKLERAGEENTFLVVPYVEVRIWYGWDSTIVCWAPSLKFEGTKLGEEVEKFGPPLNLSW